MKLQFDRETLLGRLKILSTILPKKPVLQAYSQFLFNVKGGVAWITSTDGSKQVTVSCDTQKHEGDCMFTIPGRLLISTLDLLLDSEIKLTVKDSLVRLKSGKSDYKMDSEDGTVYPLIPEIKSDMESLFQRSDPQGCF